MENWRCRLSQLLERKQISQATVARRVGVSPAAVNKWTAGGGIDYVHLRLLADLLDVNWIWLRYGAGGLDAGRRVVPVAGPDADDGVDELMRRWVHKSTAG